MTLLPLLAVGCGQSIDKRIVLVRVAPIADSLCGAPADAQNMTVRALGDFAASESSAQFIALGDSEQFDISRFPTETRMLEVEVRGSGGALRAIGRSGSFRISELVEGTEIPVFMAPLDGVCPTGPIALPRAESILVRAGTSVLVIGGIDSNGNPSSLAERYQPETGVFEALNNPLYGDIGSTGLLGASATETTEGQVALVGGSATAYQIYSQEEGEFAAPAFYREARGFHAALALPDNRVFLAAGCSQVLSAGCGTGSALLTSSLLNIANGEIESGPALTVQRIGGQAWMESEGVVLLTGGVDMNGIPVLSSERVFLDGRPSHIVGGSVSSSIQLRSGSTWMVSESFEIKVLAPLAIANSGTISTLMPDSEMQLVALNDDSILALGERAQQIRGLDGESDTLTLPALSELRGLRAIVLDDGSVLMVGLPQSAGGVSSIVFRPRLLGPFSSSVSASFTSQERSVGLSARNPEQVEIPTEGNAHMRLTVGARGKEWVLLSGPRFENFALDISGAADGTLSVIFGWQSPGNHWRVDLAEGQASVVTKVSLGQASLAEDCVGSTLAAGALSETNDSHDVAVLWRDGEISARLDNQEILHCTLQGTVLRGEVGLGVSGTLGQSMRLDFAGVDR